MATVSDLIKGSLRLIGAIASGETPTSAESADGLSALNDMLDSWSNESLVIYSKGSETFTLVGGTQSYTMGTGGNFNTVRPMRIENALLRVVSGSTTFDLPIDIVNQDQWADITIKSVQSNLPNTLWVQGTFPLETLNLWPIPNTANSLVLFSWKALSSFAAISDTISLPPGYMKALRYNLAMELSSEYGVTPSEVVAAGANESKANIKRMNVKEVILACDAATLAERQIFNYLTGE